MKKIIAIVLIFVLMSVPVCAEEVSINDWFKEHYFDVWWDDSDDYVRGSYYGYNIQFENGNLYVNCAWVQNVEIIKKDGEFYGGVDELEELYGGELAVIGECTFIKRVNDALEIIKEEYPDEYELIKNIRTISEGKRGLAFLNLQSATFSLYDTCDKNWLMSAILHEAVHIIDYNNGLFKINSDGEWNIDEMEERAYKAQRKLLVKLKAQKWIDFLDEEFERQYWKN
jgi:signal peptidase I